MRPLAWGEEAAIQRDAQALQGTPDMRRRWAAVQLLRERQRAAWVAVEDPMALTVNGHGQALGARDGAEHRERAVGILDVPKGGGEDLPGGVVDGGDQHEAGSPTVQPGVLAPVQLDEHPHAGHAVAAPAMAG